MHLTPREVDKLLIFSAGELARKRRARGLKLNHPEAVALITTEILELIRDGRSVAEIMSLGSTILTADAVMDGVPEMITENAHELRLRAGGSLPISSATGLRRPRDGRRGGGAQGPTLISPRLWFAIPARRKRLRKPFIAVSPSSAVSPQASISSKTASSSRGLWPQMARLFTVRGRPPAALRPKRSLGTRKTPPGSKIIHSS